MEPLYNVYFGGQTLPGEDPASVRKRVAQLFNASEATLDKLFNGKMHLVKRDCDRDTALKYKQALERAGARPVIKPADDGTPGKTTTAAQAPESDRPMTAAERIAALAGAPDLEGYRSDPAAEAPAPVTTSEEIADDSLDLAPPQSDVLRPDERTPPVQREVDTGTLAVEAPTDRLAGPAAPPPPAPDVSHLSMGEVGESIPTLQAGEAPPVPDTDALSLSPEGTDFSDCGSPEPDAPDLDLSALDVAPEGSDVLEERYRKKPTDTAPSTDHIALED